MSPQSPDGGATGRVSVPMPAACSWITSRYLGWVGPSTGPLRIGLDDEPATASASISGCTPSVVRCVAGGAPAWPTIGGRLRSLSRIRVGIQPGHRTDTPIGAPSPSRSRCSDRGQPRRRRPSPPRTRPGSASGSRPATDAVFTMCPGSPWASMRGTKARMPWITPQRSTPTTQSQSSSVSAHARAALHRRRRCCTARGRRRTPRSVTSASRSSASALGDVGDDGPHLVPAVRRARRLRSAAPLRRRPCTTRIPSAPKRCAIARPSPLAAPVTTATRPASCSSPRCTCRPVAASRSLGLIVQPPWPFPASVRTSSPSPPARGRAR